MGVFKNLKIRTKLIILITLMLFGLLAVGVFSMNNYINAVKALEKIYTHNIITIEKLSDARAQTRGNYANILNYIVTEDKNVRDTILNEYKTRIISINADINEFKADSSYETKQISLIKTNMNDWIQVADQIMALVSSNKQDEAIDLFTNSGDATFEKLQTSIKELINKNINQADKIYKDQVNTKSIKTIITNIFIAFMLVLCIVFGVIIIQSITGPIKKVISLIRKTSELDLAYDTSYVSLLKNTDEIGIIAQSVEGLRDELRKVIEKVLNISSNVAENSEVLAASTEENTKTINQIVNAINEIAQGNSNQADMVSKTNQTVMTMTTNIDEVNSETGTNSENAEKAIEIIKEGQKAVELTVKKMVENKEVTGDVGKSIEDLSMQIEKVGNIISVIKDISSQTNLLALNASIEAARAGESGKGFAVVATEIGSLAKETDAAVDEITKIIMDTVAKNTQASQKMSAANNIVLEQEHAINITKEAFQKIKTSVDDIAEHTLIISNRINEIDASSNEISDQTQDMSAIAQEAAASSEEISASNEEQLASIELIASAANELSRMATELNDEVIKFKLK